MVANPLKYLLRKPVEVFLSRGFKKEDKAVTTTETQWTDKQPHPTNIDKYDGLCNDPETNIALTLLADMVAGPGFYTEMPDEFQPNKPDEKPHKHKTVIDDYAETVNLDEDLKTIVRVMLGKGFCPVERLSDYDLKILPPEGFFIWRNRKGKLLKYTQEIQNSTVATWKGDEMKDIILFVQGEDPSHPYGKALVDPIADLIDARQRMNEDMPQVIHRYAYPMGIWQSSRDISAIEDAVSDREVDEDIFIGNVEKDEVNVDFISVDPQARFVPYIELIYYQICEALHAPLLLYLKNATEASATVMLEAVDRFVQGIQRYVKRRVEKFLFEPQCGEPVPRLVWGQPKTGLEEIELAQIADLYRAGAIKFNQAQDILKSLGLKLIEPEMTPQPQPLPFQEQPPKPLPQMQMLEKLNDLQTALNIIETNYREKTLSLIKAVGMGQKAISVYIRRMHPNNEHQYRLQRNEEFDRWIRRLLGMREADQNVFTVKVD